MKSAWRGVAIVKWLAIAVGAVVLLAVLALALPFLVALDRFIPDVAAIAAEKLGQPVSIAQMHLQILPTPRAIATGITVGKRQEVRVGELAIVPDLIALLAGSKVIRLVRAEDVHVKEAALAIAGKLPKGGQGTDVLVRRVELFKVKLQHSAIKLPEFDVRAEFGEGFALERAHLDTRDNALRLIVDPEPDGSAKVSLEATRWTLPGAYPVRFEWLAVEGTLKGERLELAKI